MEGSARAAKREMELDVVRAWDIARMGAESQSKRGLRRLQHYLNELKPKAPVHGAELVAAFRSMKKHGAAVTMTKIKREVEGGLRA